MNKQIIKIEKLNKIYKYKNNFYKILNNCNLEINKNDIISIVGPSGVGKSTLLNIIGLLDKHNSGQYYFENSNILRLNKISKFRNRNVGFVHQFFYLLPELSILENVALPNMILGNSVFEANKNAKKLLNIFGLNKRLDFKPSFLSGGEQQRVSIARALINKPKLIIADEMTGNLDENTSDEIFNFFLNEIKKNKQTLIYATHNEKYAKKAQIKLKLSKGKLVKK